MALAEVCGGIVKTAMYRILTRLARNIDTNIGTENIPSNRTTVSTYGIIPGSGMPPLCGRSIGPALDASERKNQENENKRQEKSEGPEVRPIPWRFRGVPWSVVFNEVTPRR